MRHFVLAEIKACPNGWDPDQCYDDGRELNPCGTDNQHCLGDGTCIEYSGVISGPDRTEGLLDIIDCSCGKDWTEKLQGGDPYEGAGVSVYACPLCRQLKAPAIAAGYGTCTAVPR